MSSLDEQLALFEKEVAAVAKVPPPSSKVSLTMTSSGNDHAGPEETAAKPKLASGSSMTQFVPHQLKVPHYTTLRTAGVPGLEPSPSVIESGPTLYPQPSAVPATSVAVAAQEQRVQQQDTTHSSAAGSATSQASNQPGPSSGGLRTMALPSDVELLVAKKQAARAHENSYLGQVLRGERKMKRFVRSAAGTTWEDPSLAEWDPNDFRVFCGDLGNEVSDELLAKAFRKYPSFQKAKVVRDHRTNKSKGYGFVSFKHQDDFVRACREMDGKYVGNRPIKLRKSVWKDRNVDVVKKKKRDKQKLGLM